MRFLRYFPVALDSIRAHKLRSSLTMLGIIIGVAAVLSTIGIGRGASAQITAQVASQGTNLLTINPGANFFGGVAGSGSVRTLTIGDAVALADKTYHPDLGAIAPTYSANAQLVVGSNNSNSQVVGTVAAYLSVRNLVVASGRFLTDTDITDQSQVVVLGSSLATDLFVTDPVGQQVRIGSEPFLRLKAT